jgi:hypothetical protein
MAWLEHMALYSMWTPGDVTTAAIRSTRLNPVRAWDESNLTTSRSLLAYLIRMGASVFRDAKAHAAYVKALEAQLLQGLAPAAARDAAL